MIISIHLLRKAFSSRKYNNNNNISNKTAFKNSSRLTRFIHPFPPPTNAHVGRKTNLRKRILLNMLVVTQLTKKYPTPYVIKSFIPYSPHLDTTPIMNHLNKVMSSPHIYFTTILRLTGG
jgi:hypothetical protein